MNKHVWAWGTIALTSLSAGGAIGGEFDRSQTRHASRAAEMTSRSANENQLISAKKLRESGIVLLDSLAQAEKKAKGPALMINVPPGKQKSDFGINSFHYVDGSLVRVNRSKKGFKVIESEKNDERISNPAQIAEAMKKMPLTKAIELAQKEQAGEVINAGGYVGNDDKVVIDVKIVNGDQLHIFEFDPETGKKKGEAGAPEPKDP